MRKITFDIHFKLAVFFFTNISLIKSYWMPVIHVLVAKKSSIAINYDVGLKSLCNTFNNWPTL